MKNHQLKSILLINMAMLCISTSGVLGRYISFAPPLTIWLRASFALVFLGLFCWFKRYKFRLSLKDHGSTIFFSGILLAIHWVTYFYSLKWSNVAVAIITLFTYPIITTILEPIFLKTKYQLSHFFLCIIIMVGIYLLTPSFDLNDSMTLGILMGLVSALCYAVRNLFLKPKVSHFNGSILMFYQMVVTLLFLAPVLLYYPIDQQEFVSQFPFVLFLGLVTTAIGHSLFLNALKYFSVSTASIMSSVQPIFAIFLAVIFLNEYPDSRSIIGGSLILITVIIESIRSTKSSIIDS